MKKEKPVTKEDQIRERPKEFDTDGCIRLVSAVIEKACDDYKFGTAKTRRSIEQFFRSTYFSNISDLDPRYVIKNLRECYPERIRVEC